MVTLRNLLGFLPWTRSDGRHAAERDAGEIRHAMLALLQFHSGNRVQNVAQRIRFANDLEALWYLRQDVVTALSDFDGESAARRKIKEINVMFKGRLPTAMGPRSHQRFSN